MSKDPQDPDNKISILLLKWYDKFGRDLPWRVKGNQKPNPYKVWISEIMLQQTTVKTVIPYYEKFILKWPDIFSLSLASQSEIMSMWSGLGYYRRARNMHLCAQFICNKFEGQFPNNEKKLIKLPGIGVYTAAAISSIAFNQRAVVVDGNIERVVSRLFAVKESILKSKKIVRSLTNNITPNEKNSDFVQAMMDLGALVCKPSNPLCDLCPISLKCVAKKKGEANNIPYKEKKITKDIRNGIAIIIKRKNEILFYTRPIKGLLGGMDAIPSYGWDEIDNNNLKFLKNLRKNKIGQISHNFSHFKLTIKIYSSKIDIDDECKIPKFYKWIKITEIKKLALPSLMEKILKEAKLIS